MPDSARFALHRPEFVDSLLRGEAKIARMMAADSIAYAAGDLVIQAQSQHQYVYRLKEGWACRSRLLADGRNQFILIFLPGDLFAVKSMFMSCHVDGVRALSPIVADRIHYKALHSAFVEDGDVAARCLWQVMEEERRLHGWVVGLGQGSAEERMAYLLLDFRGRLILSNTIEPHALSYQMPLTQAQLADHLGITAVHSNRVLKEFRQKGVVTVRDGKVNITDLKAMATYAAPLMDVYERTMPAYGAEERAELNGSIKPSI
jgi:CRP-like cAMP-binding protein